jgi:hypothetical protein
MSTPLLGAVMAIVTRLMSVASAADLLNVLNLVLALGTIGFVLVRLRAVLPSVWWWVCACCMVSFGPLMSTVWWKQFNLIALAGALVGFYLIRSRHTVTGGGVDRAVDCDQAARGAAAVRPGRSTRDPPRGLAGVWLAGCF